MSSSNRRRRRLFSACLGVLVAFTAAAVDAEVERVEITSREVFAGGADFGDTGPYEKIRGSLFYAVDPDAAANRAVVDLELAPRGADGKVRFRGDFVLLKPVDLERGNGRLLYDVNNRGNLYMLRHINGGSRTNDPSTLADAGNGFLMKQGYALLWSAWNWDVRAGDHRLQIELPIASRDGETIRQRIAAEIVNSFTAEPLPSMPLAWGGSRCYPALDAADNSQAVLTVRDAPDGERQPIADERWRLARIEHGVEVPDPTHLTIDGGIEPGRIYELIYEAQNPRVVGLGLAAVRDAISFFRFDGADRTGTPSPLAVRGAEGSWRSSVERAYMFGVSQSGRFITHMLWQGFHVDEADRMVVDGARIHVAGGGKGGFNHRFAQTTHHPSHLEGNSFPADHPPFNFLPEGWLSDNDVLARAKALGAVPRIIITNNALEYWTRSASLVHTDPTGTVDALFHPSVRYYMTNGAPHGGASSRKPTITEHGRNPLGVGHLQRAMLVNLDRWVTDGVEPPPSRFPRIGSNELITASEHADRFPEIPGMRHPGSNLQPRLVDSGPRFWSDGVFSVVPPKMGETFRTFVPAFDDDGNGVGGIRLPELSVPLGTYQGFNPRSEAAGNPEFLTRFDGSFRVFPTTEDERQRAGDPRRSIEARYASHQEYVDRVAAAANELARQRLLLPEDAGSTIELAGRLEWPPTPVDEAPFWRLGEGRLAPSETTAADAAAAVAELPATYARPEVGAAETTAAPSASPGIGTKVGATAVDFAGGVQVSAEPGLRVLFDGEPVGTTNRREDGLYLTEVSRGRHTITVEKTGFEPQTFDVQVVQRPIEVEVGRFVPVEAADEAAGSSRRGGVEVGSLVVTSAPQNVTVEIAGRVERKTTPQLSIGGLAVGEHELTFSKEGFEPVTSTIAIEPGAENTIHGDLKATAVSVVRHGMGAMRITSKPMSCTIWFRNEIYEKTHDRLNIGKIPAGEYSMVVMIPGRRLATTVLIVDGQRTDVEVSFIKGDDPFVITRVQK